MNYVKYWKLTEVFPFFLYCRHHIFIVLIKITYLIQNTLEVENYKNKYTNHLDQKNSEHVEK